MLDLLYEIGLLDCKPDDTLIAQNHKLVEYPDQVPTNKERYQRLVHKLIYLSLTRPSIAFVVSIVSQFMHLPIGAYGCSMAISMQTGLGASLIGSLHEATLHL